MRKLSRTYRKWDSMIGRCHRESHPAYRYYGAKGVQVCSEWRGSFESFLKHVGECPEGMWLDRIDNGKGYEPGNVRWVTPKQSAQNRRKRPQVEGSLRQKARAAGLPYYVVYLRVTRLGWSEEKALSTPKRTPGRKAGERKGIPRDESALGSTWNRVPKTLAQIRKEVNETTP